jgi:predicted lipoprotein with Yx(FWY)xxD motif
MKLRLVLILTALSIILAACGGENGGLYGGGDETAAGTAEVAENGETAATDEPAAAPSSETVAVTDSPLGQIVTDSKGRTLYLFTNDPKDGTSACADDCLANWPAVEGAPAAGEGVDGALLGTITRGDGATQATYNDWPLYYFAGDQASGDVNGQGVGDVWYVVAPDGTAVQG